MAVSPVYSPFYRWPAARWNSARYSWPEYIGRGCGAALWRHAVERARELGFTAMELAAGPNAELFYRHCGAVSNR